MAEEKEDAHAGEDEGKGKSGNKSLILIIVILVVALVGGIGAYLLVFRGSAKHADEIKKEEPKEAKSTLIALDAFVLNLSERGRFLKVTMQFELNDASNLGVVTDKTPQLRDAIITLVSSKSVESVSSPEGKFQLKDELLLRANQAMGRDIFKNLYFTEFVMQ